MAAGTLGLVFEREEDLAGALTLFRRAAEAGDDQAQFNLGRLLLGQEAVDEAKDWLRKSRDPRATDELRRLGE
jgi:TPR repeat protein